MELEGARVVTREEDVEAEEEAEEGETRKDL